KDRETERNRLLALAQTPGADLADVAAQTRELAVLVMTNGTAWGRAAAEAALAGPDDVVIDYLRHGWNTAQEQDDRSYVERLAEESETKEVRDAAEAALKGDAAAITAFVKDGQYQAGAQGMRVAIAQAVADAGPILKEAGQKALATDDPKKYSEFLLTAQPVARTQDERVRAAQLVDSGTPEVKSAARIALEGSPQTLHAYISSGQFKAQRKDHLNATHVAQVQKLISDAAKVAATAQQNAATAQKVAATARKAAAEAAQWAKKADESATRAQGYADQAAQHAKDAEASAASAAASAKTARSAADNADLAASDAARSATDATLSSESAQAEASSAWYAADRARASAIAAGKDAEAALKAATEAFTIAVTKHKEEAEARRKAAVEAKEKAKNDAGARAREMYRCGQAYIPCDPQGFARWCQHNEIYCDILAHGDEFGAAMNDLLDMGKEIAGLGNLEKCMDNKDFENCWELGTDVLIGAKLKALDKTFDALKLLKLGCTKCFLAGTGVLMGDGSVKNIEDVRPGDEVLATDPVTGESGPRKVTRLIRTEDDKHFNTLSITTEDGVEELTATHEHPFWSPSEGAWVAARDLAPDMTLLTDSGDTVIVTGNKGFTQRARTYNLTVTGLHTYYALAGDTPVLVHNSGGLCPKILEETYKSASTPAKLEHVIDPEKHGFAGLVARSGGREQAMRRIVNSLDDAADLPAAGRFEVRRVIDGENVTIRGAVVNGVPRIGTAFNPDKFPGGN
ncbi:polymorphic toxin-type HINT domain-containing protein, partial [Streptomyces rubiginosohelvolus]